MERWLKRVWLINGIVLFALLALGLGFAAVAAVREWRGNEAVAVAAPTPRGRDGSADRVRAVRFDVPHAVRGTSTRIVLVRHGADYLAEKYAGLSGGSGYDMRVRDGPVVNVIFLPAEGAPGRLLFVRPAYLTDVSYPGKEYGRADSLQTWIAYQVVLEDSDADGKLDEDDQQELFVSDLEGRSLRRVLPAGWRLKEYESLRNGRELVVTALEAAKPGVKRDEQRALQRAFLYDVPTSRLQSLPALDSLVAEAGRLLGGAQARPAR
jgi:hypothetical protein